MRVHETALNKTKTKATFTKEICVFDLSMCEYNTILIDYGFNQIKNEVKADLQFRISQCQFWLNVLISDKRGDIFEILLKWKSSTNSREISQGGEGWQPQLAKVIGVHLNKYCLPLALPISAKYENLNCM